MRFNISITIFINIADVIVITLLWFNDVSFIIILMYIDFVNFFDDDNIFIDICMSVVTVQIIVAHIVIPLISIFVDLMTMFMGMVVESIRDGCDFEMKRDDSLTSFVSKEGYRLKY